MTTRELNRQFKSKLSEYNKNEDAIKNLKYNFSLRKFRELRAKRDSIMNDLNELRREAHRSRYEQMGIETRNMPPNMMLW